MVAILLALLSAASWGTGDFIGGTSARRVAVVVVLFVSQAAGLVLAALLVLAVGDAWPGLGAMWPALLGGAAGAGALGCFYRALAIGTMSVVAPISSTAVVVPVIAGLATGDRPSAPQAAGIVLAIVGIVFASREPAGQAAHTASRTSILLALAAAVGFGVFLTALSSSSDDSVAWSLLCARVSSVALVGAALLAARQVRLPRVEVPRLIAVGIFDIGANGTFALATTKGLLSVVSVLGALYPVTTVILARFLLHERLTRIQQAGVACAFCGVGLIAT